MHKGKRPRSDSDDDASQDEVPGHEGTPVKRNRTMRPEEIEDKSGSRDLALSMCLTLSTTQLISVVTALLIGSASFFSVSGAEREIKKKQKNPETTEEHGVWEEAREYILDTELTTKTPFHFLRADDEELSVRPLDMQHVHNLVKAMTSKYVGEFKPCSC